MAEKQCPPQERWQDFLIGRVEAQSVTDLEDHLRDCPSCLETLNGLQTDDSLVEAIRRPVQKPDADQAAFLETFAHRLQQIDQSSGGNRLDAVTQVNANEDWESPPAGEDVQALLGFLQPAQGPDELGRLGGYRIIKVLGVGGMGVVFLAEDTQLKRQVALKAMKPILAVNAGAGQRFEREAQAAAAINHDNVITIHQVGFEQGVPFLAMQLLEGETLDQRLRRDGTLPVAEVIRIGREIAAGLDAAHSHGLIHRDIKPANVWLEARGDRVKLVDFGLVRATGQDVQITREGAIVGTPAYMAPEQAQGAKVDARADLFSLGCVLYRMATGQLPFRGNDTISILFAIGTQAPLAPKELNPRLPISLSDLILRLLAKEPQNRPESAQAVADCLADLEQNPQPAVATLSRQRGGWGALACLAAAIALVLPFTWMFGGTILRFAMNKGELVVDIRDPEVTLSVVQKKLVLFDKAKQRTFELDAGEGEVLVYEKDGVGPIATKFFTLNRGGKTTVTVTMRELDRVKVRPDLVQEKTPSEKVTPLAKKSRLLAQVPHEKNVSAVAFSKAASWLIAGGTGARDNHNLKFYDVVTAKEIGSLAMAGELMTFDIDRNGKILACAGNLKVKDEFVIQIVDAVQRKVIKNIKVERGDIDKLALSPDGHSLAWMNSKTAATSLFIQDLRTDKRHEEQAKVGTIRHITFSGDARWLVVCTHTGSNRIYELTTMTLQPFNHGKYFFSPDGRFMAHNGARGSCFDLKRQTNFPGLFISGGKNSLQLSKNIEKMAFSAGSHVLAAGLEDDSIALIDPESRQQILSIQPQRWTSFAVSPDAKVLATGTATGIVEIWDISEK